MSKYYAEYRKKWRAENQDKVKAHGKNHREKKKQQPLTEKEIEQRRKHDKTYANKPEVKAKRNTQRFVRYHTQPTTRAAHRFRRYGLTQDQYEQLLLEQTNQCAICNQEFATTPHVDHCHETGKVRGLLCRKCNSGLGMLKDNIDNLVRAITYLSKE